MKEHLDRDAETGRFEAKSENRDAPLNSILSRWERPGIFQHPLHREEYIRTADRIPAATMHPRYFSITLFFNLIILFAGFHGANAETPG
jgi:hypothetical protein